MHKLLLAAAALGLFAAAPAAAQAEGAEIGQVTVVHGVVRYVAWELASPAPAERLFQRIRHRATKLCLSEGLRMQAGLSADDRACRDRALARAIRDLDAPLVTAAFERRTVQQVASR